MASNDKTFYFYFKENMMDTGLPCPETLFETATAAVANIGLMADYVAKNHGVKLRKMLKDIPKIATIAAGGGVARVAPVVAKSAVTTLEIGAAFYVGACIGSLFVATVKSGSDLYTRSAGNRSMNMPVFYKVHDVSTLSKQKNITMSSEVQKVLHRHSGLYQCH